MVPIPVKKCIMFGGEIMFCGESWFNLKCDTVQCYDGRAVDVFTAIQKQEYVNYNLNNVI